MKIDPADKWFSLYIRERDNWQCQRCGRKYDRDEPNQLQNSHFFGRVNWTTRFSDTNCISLCYGCHKYYDETNREEYRDFKIRQLGEKGFQKLKLSAGMTGHKDWKLARIITKKLYYDICKKKGLQPK
jgi:hypothetical protein